MHRWRSFYRDYSIIEINSRVFKKNLTIPNISLFVVSWKDEWMFLLKFRFSDNATQRFGTIFHLILILMIKLKTKRKGVPIFLGISEYINFSKMNHFLDIYLYILVTTIVFVTKLYNLSILYLIKPLLFYFHQYQLDGLSFFYLILY